MAGLGLGRSVQAYGYLPEAANDSIFAIYAEKFGFILVVLPSGYRRDRVTSFLHPEAGCSQAAGYQACQALIAVG
jgi:cell division protein FtsW (lipid II flippase)